MANNERPPSRALAIDGILNTAGSMRKFTVTDIINQSEFLEDPHRRTIKRALNDMEKLGRVKHTKTGSRYWESNLLPEKRERKSVNELPEPSGDISILHVFADRGVESEALEKYGEVVRIGINAVYNESSEAIRADANHLPIKPGVKFDIGVFHPPCGRWAEITNITGDSGDWPNLIPLSREIAEKHCREYIIENKPKAPLENPTKLNGKMFGLPIAYERAFETSFTVNGVPGDSGIETECSPYFYSDRSKGWWAGVKGYSMEYPKQHIAKNSIPSAYIHFLMRNYLSATNARDADNARSSHSDRKPERLD